MEALGQDVLDQTVEKFHGGDGGGFPVLGGERDLVRRDLQEPGVGDANPVGVAGQIGDYVAGVAESATSIRNVHQRQLEMCI